MLLLLRCLTARRESLDTHSGIREDPTLSHAFTHARMSRSLRCVSGCANRLSWRSWMRTTPCKAVRVPRCALFGMVLGPLQVFLPCFSFSSPSPLRKCTSHPPLFINFLLFSYSFSCSRFALSLPRSLSSPSPTPIKRPRSHQEKPVRCLRNPRALPLALLRAAAGAAVWTIVMKAVKVVAAVSRRRVA